MQIEKLKTDRLIPADYNPRKDLKPGDPEYEKLKRSLEEFGYVEPVIWNKTTGHIVGGHQRLKVLLDMGITEVECVVVEMDAEKEKALNVALNKISGDWDKDKLALLIADLQGADFDVSLTGFGPGEIDDLFKESLKDGIKDDDFDVEAELQKPAVTKPGDVWLLGRHRLACGDSTKASTFTALMDGKLANLVVTDPPYNVNYEGTAGKIKNDNMGNEAFYDFLLAAFTNTETSMAQDSSIYVFHADTEGLNFRKAFSDAGFQLSGCCIWKKPSLVLGRSPYQWQHEPCQPAGTMVQTINGPRAIETLQDGDRVVSYNSYSGVITGMKNGGYAIKTANRFYNGDLYGIQVEDKLTWTTDSHIFSVRFKPSARHHYCTYLMRRGNRWRVGITELYNARGFGLKTRLRGEDADAAWVIDTFPDKIQAQCGEQVLSVRYGIPYTHWQIQRGLNAEAAQRSRSAEHVDFIYDSLDLEVLHNNALRLLAAYGRRVDYPFITRENGSEAFSTRVSAKIRACNIIPGIMQLPIPHPYCQEDMSNFYWHEVEGVLRKGFSGKVYSLDVEKFHHYIADGIVTHNCLFGWKKKGKHNWYSDRKQTTIWEFEKPKKNADHPTMKPIALVAYPIMNSSLTNCIVLDPFGGSGSTLIACEQSDRICFIIELDEKYCDVIVKRYIEQVGSADGVSVIRDGVTMKYAEVTSDE